MSSLNSLHSHRAALSSNDASHAASLNPPRSAKGAPQSAQRNASLRTPASRRIPLFTSSSALSFASAAGPNDAGASDRLASATPNSRRLPRSVLGPRPAAPQSVFVTASAIGPKAAAAESPTATASQASSIRSVSSRRASVLAETASLPPFDAIASRRTFAETRARIEKTMGRMARQATSDFALVGTSVSLTVSAIAPILMLTLAHTVPPLTAVVGVVWLLSLVVGAGVEAVLKRRAFRKVDEATLQEIDALYATLCAREATLGAARSNDELSLLNDVNELVAQMVGGTWHLFRQVFANLLRWSLPCPRFAPGALMATRNGEAPRRFVPMAMADVLSSVAAA